MATVEVTFTALPAHVRTARLVATAVARRSGVAESLMDEVRLAVGEACSRAVETHAEQCPDKPVRVALSSQAGRFQIEVINVGGPGADRTGTDRTGTDRARVAGERAVGTVMPPGFSLAVIAGLADDVEVTQTEAGTSVKMSWPLSGSLAAGSAAAGSPA